MPPSSFQKLRDAVFLVPLALAAMLMLASGSNAAKPVAPQPDGFLIGRRTFFDFGPPFEYFEVFSVQTAGKGTRMERIQMTPPGDKCAQPAAIEASMGSIDETVSDLLGSKNPCTIPTKELNREIKPCPHCMTFSGADIVMQVSCGAETRRIRMDVLDRDMFDAHPATTEHTSWTMSLLNKLDRVLGSTIMDRPAFTLKQPASLPELARTPLMDDLEKGTLNSLFWRGSFSPSEIFRESRTLPQPSTTELIASSVPPATYELPKYPPIARLAHVGGQVSVTVRITPDGHASKPLFSRGNPVLLGATEASVASWTFPPDAAGRDVKIVIQFNLNCAANAR
jgi:hypothetical protein